MSKAVTSPARPLLITHHEVKDQFVFDGMETGLAKFYRQRVQGADVQEVKAKRIIYSRATGELKIENTLGVRN